MRRMSVGTSLGFRAGVSIDGDSAVIAFEGELDFGIQPQARAAIERAGDVRVLVIDLRELTFMDTSGVHLLIQTRDRCRAGGRMLLVVPGPARVHRALEALGLEREFTFVSAP
jgi:anti-sigma B factor antagonist